jgi:hypothetical protein
MKAGLSIRTICRRNGHTGRLGAPGNARGRESKKRSRKSLCSE